MSFDIHSDFQTQPCDKFCNRVADGTHDSPQESETGKLLVTSKNVKGGRLSRDSAYRISIDDFNAINKRSKVDQWDLLLTMIGTVGEVCLVEMSNPDFAIKNVGLLKCGDELRARWLYYFLRSPMGQEAIEQRKKGSTQQYISLTEIRQLPIPFPSQWQEMKLIVDHLATLDDRITLLRETNATLEAIAQALFKSWFVDFDPVRAKLEGRAPEGMDEATARLFPDSFEESELGLVPSGWRVCKVLDVAKLFSGGTPDTRKPEYWVGDLRWFSSGETRDLIIVDTEKRINLKAVTNSSTKLALPGDILIASAGQGHTRGQTSYCAIDTYINQSVVSVRAKVQECGSLWLFNNLIRRYPEMRDLSDSHSSRGSLTTKLLGGMPIAMPPKDVLSVFEETANALTNSQISNTQSAQTLATLRDTLLPRLISGQLRLPQAQAAAEEALA